MEWNDMSTAPTDGGLYLVSDGKVVVTARMLRDSVETYTYRINPTHWMPMPDKPVKKHYCSVNEMSCYTDQNGTLFLKTFSQLGRHVLYSVKFCPFCGEEGEK